MIPADAQQCRDWLKEHLTGFSCGEIAESAQCTKRTAENIRAGANGMRMEYLVAMLRNNNAFRAAFFEFVGGAESELLMEYVRRESV